MPSNISRLMTLCILTTFLVACGGPEGYRKVDNWDALKVKAHGQCSVQSLQSRPASTPSAGTAFAALAVQAAVYNACMQGKGYRR